MCGTCGESRTDVAAEPGHLRRPQRVLPLPPRRQHPSPGRIYGIVERDLMPLVEAPPTREHPEGDLGGDLGDEILTR